MTDSRKKIKWSEEADIAFHEVERFSFRQDTDPLTALKYFITEIETILDSITAVTVLLEHEDSDLTFEDFDVVDIFRRRVKYAERALDVAKSYAYNKDTTDA